MRNSSRLLPLIIATLLPLACVQSEEEETVTYYELSGHLIDNETQLPLVGANVELVGTGIGSVSGPEGTYSIHAVPAGEYTVRISHGSRHLRTDDIHIPGRVANHLEVRELSERSAPRRLPMTRPAPSPSGADAEPRTDEYVIVEKMPDLIGGLEALQQEIRYPVIAKKAGIEGRVIVQFVVTEEGRVENAQVVRGIGGGCDEEALRAVRQARFVPGQQRGQTVRVRMSLPIRFQLPD